VAAASARAVVSGDEPHYLLIARSLQLDGEMSPTRSIAPITSPPRRVHEAKRLLELLRAHMTVQARNQRLSPACGRRNRGRRADGANSCPRKSIGGLGRELISAMGELASDVQGTNTEVLGKNGSLEQGASPDPMSRRRCSRSSSTKLLDFMRVPKRDGRMALRT